MLKPAATYAELMSGFSWNLPERFNIGVAISSTWARQAPDKLAMIEHMDDGPARRTTFAQLDAMANRIANLLVSNGIGPGDRVALLLPQCRETAAAHAAIYKLGAIAVPLAMLFGVEALQYRLQNSGARALLMSTASRDNVAEVRPSLAALEHIFCIDGTLEFAAHLHDACAPMASAVRGPRHQPRRPLPDDLHLRHHRPAQGRAARPPGVAGPPARRPVRPRVPAPARRPDVDALRLGMGGRAAQRAAAVAPFRRAGAGLPFPQVRPGLRLGPAGAIWRAQRLRAAHRAEADARLDPAATPAG